MDVDSIGAILQQDRVTDTANEDAAQCEALACSCAMQQAWPSGPEGCEQKRDVAPGNPARISKTASSTTLDKRPIVNLFTIYIILQAGVVMYITDYRLELDDAPNRVYEMGFPNRRSRASVPILIRHGFSDPSSRSQIHADDAPKTLVGSMRPSAHSDTPVATMVHLALFRSWRTIDCDPEKSTLLVNNWTD
jgi:hypothetical protein